MDKTVMLGSQADLVGKESQETLQKSNIVVIGAGATGSWAAITLAKMGCENVSFYDDDTVEEKNYANQIYGPGDIGAPKIEALANFGYAYLPITDKWVHKERRITADSIPDADVVICAVDSIEVRRELFEAYRWKEGTNLWLDARIGRLIAKCFAIDVNSLEECKYYEQKSCFPGEQAADIPCTEKTFISSCLHCSAFFSAALLSYAKKDIDAFPYSEYIDMKTRVMQQQKRSLIREAGLCL